MRRCNNDLESVKKKLKALKGIPIEMDINRGRKKIDRITATINELYPSVFTISSNGTIQTFSYFDIMCGNVKIL